MKSHVLWGPDARLGTSDGTLLRTSSGPLFAKWGWTIKSSFPVLGFLVDHVQSEQNKVSHGVQCAAPYSEGSLTPDMSVF
jgi:hypothetical protein